MTRHFAITATLFLPLWVTDAAADQAPPPEPAPEPAPDAAPEPAPKPDEQTQVGLEAYERGIAATRDGQWGTALEAFETAAAARDAPVIQFNIAYCRRALGRYVAAREAIRVALVGADSLPALERQDADAYLREFEEAIVEVEVELEPAQATLAVDGRPLVASGGLLLAGVAPPGAGKVPGKNKFKVALDPGPHVFSAIRKGHAPVLLRRTYRPGARDTLSMRLDRLPAQVKVSSVPAGAVVRIRGREVGVTPVQIERPAGRYDFEVLLDEYENYEASLELSSGQDAKLAAKLVPYDPPIYTRWWFWTIAAGVVAGGALITYGVTRPEPEPPPYATGNTGWLIEPAAIRF